MAVAALLLEIKAIIQHCVFDTDNVCFNEIRTNLIPTKRFIITFYFYVISFRSLELECIVITCQPHQSSSLLEECFVLRERYQRQIDFPLEMRFKTSLAKEPKHILFIYSVGYI